MVDLNEIDFIGLAEDIDNVIADFCEKYKIDTFMMGGVMIARLTLCAECGGYMEDFKQLLEGIRERCEDPSNPKHADTLH